MADTSGVHAAQAAASATHSPPTAQSCQLCSTASRRPSQRTATQGSPRHVAAVALGQHVFAEGAQRLARHDAPARLRLQHHLKLLAVHQFLPGPGGGHFGEGASWGRSQLEARGGNRSTSRVHPVSLGEALPPCPPIHRPPPPARLELGHHAAPHGVRLVAVHHTRQRIHLYMWEVAVRRCGKLWTHTRTEGATWMRGTGRHWQALQTGRARGGECRSGAPARPCHVPPRR